MKLKELLEKTKNQRKLNYLSRRLYLCACVGAVLLLSLLCRIGKLCFETSAGFLPLILAVLLSSGYAFLVYRLVIRPYQETKKIYEQFAMGYVLNDFFHQPHPLTPESELAIQRLNEILDRNNLIHHSKKQAEYLALQNQINPHFLYNTLNTISAMAEIENMHDIVRITDCISNIFRYNLKGETQVSLREELAHVRDYVQIQMFRFPGRFSAEYRVDEELMDIRVMKFILQPIVENSITHGLFDRETGGKVIIGAIVEEEHDLLLSVSDNGQGINRKRLEEINQRLFAYRSLTGGDGSMGADGIGLMNVNARIMGHYGNGCGISIYSEYGKGTKVILRLNAEQEEHGQGGAV